MRLVIQVQAEVQEAQFEAIRDAIDGQVGAIVTIPAYSPRQGEVTGETTFHGMVVGAKEPAGA